MACGRCCELFYNEDGEQAVTTTEPTRWPGHLPVTRATYCLFTAFLVVAVAHLRFLCRILHHHLNAACTVYPAVRPAAFWLVLLQMLDTLFGRLPTYLLPACSRP